LTASSARAARLKSVYKHLVRVREKKSHETFRISIAVMLALAFTVPAFGGETAKESEAQCQKDGGTWDAKTKHCSGKY
jgi:hypothetical protein